MRGSNHRVAVYSQQIREFLLTAAIRGRQVAQDSEVGRIQIQPR
ncbi:hypothetical protein [Nocardia albiluteola]|nr:hypothetical protein [Nocardia albiluteola]